MIHAIKSWVGGTAQLLYTAIFQLCLDQCSPREKAAETSLKLIAHKLTL